MRSAIQLYTVRGIDEPYLDLIDRVGETSFEGVEFANRVDEVDAADVRDRLAENDLEPVSAHVGIEELEDDFEKAVGRAKALGYEHVAIPWLDPEHFESVAAVEAVAERLSDLNDALAAEGITLHYHNHDQEFTETEDGHAYHVLVEQAPNLHLQIDAGWALAGGVDPAALIEQYGERVTLVHMKDVEEGMSAADDLTPEEVPELGEGDLELDAVAAAAEGVGAEWLIYENDLPVDPVEAGPHGASILERYV